MKTFWISFSGENGAQGICILDSESDKLAVRKALDMGIHPGGEAAVFEMSNSASSREEIRSFGKDKLITPEELKKRGYETIEEMGQDAKDHFDSDSNLYFEG